MPIRHQFVFPTETLQMAYEMSQVFDLHVNNEDYVEFHWMPGTTWKILRKKFYVLGDGSVERVDYLTERVEDPELP
jgi:hypothetical protein